MNVRPITPVLQALDHEVSVPGSKSLSNRALIAAALSEGRSRLANALFAEDTSFLMDGLRRLGLDIRADPQEKCVELVGCAGHWPAASADIDCGESGTMLRLLTAACAAGRGTFRLSGRGRLHERPMQPLIDALQTLGARIECAGCEGHAPLTVHAQGLHGGAVTVDAAASSQFLSAVLLAAPCATGAVAVRVRDAAVSRPYVALTVDVMRRFAVRVERGSGGRWFVPAPQRYKAADYSIEPDASSAGYFLAAAAICGGRVRVPGLGRDSLQGEARLLALLRKMGCELKLERQSVEVRQHRDSGPLRSFDADLADLPDSVPTAAVLALFADGASRLRGIEHLRHKESDRLAGLAAQLQRLGAAVVLGAGGLTIQPPPRIRPATLQTYGDHRMAMALSLAGLAVPGVAIENPACVAKSFPEFFVKLEALARPAGPARSS
jgi:3-phosphoshikimate 1-carboxyvinyltransferase